MKCFTSLFIICLLNTVFNCNAQNTCQQLLKSLLNVDPALSSIKVTMVTLNNKGVASFTVTRLYYELEKRDPRGFVKQQPAFRTLRPNAYGEQEPKFDFGKEAQVFSDRIGEYSSFTTAEHVGILNWRAQKFDYHQADDIDMEITDAPEVEVHVTLRSWNNGKITFKPNCQGGGLLTGETDGCKYILLIETWPGQLY
jgi:hypothetical protein